MNLIFRSVTYERVINEIKDSLAIVDRAQIESVFKISFITY